MCEFTGLPLCRWAFARTTETSERLGSSLMKFLSTPTCPTCLCGLAACSLNPQRLYTGCLSFLARSRPGPTLRAHGSDPGAFLASLPCLSKPFLRTHSEVQSLVSRTPPLRGEATARKTPRPRWDEAVWVHRGAGWGNGVRGCVRVSVQLGLNFIVGAREGDRGATDEPRGLTRIVDAAPKCNLILRSRAEARLAPGWTGRDGLASGRMWQM